jgi:hypothetical protein
MNKLLSTLKCFHLVIITIGTLYATIDQFMYHGAILAILAGISLVMIEDTEYAFGY